MNSHYIRRFQEVAAMLLTEVPPENLIADWITDKWETAQHTLQDFCSEKAKLKWMTGIDTVDAIQVIIEGAVGNANLSEDYSTEFPVHSLGHTP